MPSLTHLDGQTLFFSLELKVAFLLLGVDSLDTFELDTGYAINASLLLSLRQVLVVWHSRVGCQWVVLGFTLREEEVLFLFDLVLDGVLEGSCIHATLT